MKKRRAIVSLSGGMDSATVLAFCLKEQREVVQCVAFTYGSKHNQYENLAADAIADYYKVRRQFINLANVMEGFKSDLLKTGGEIPEGHYEAESMERTVVPGRNLIFASILTGLAWSLEADEIWMGFHAGDHAIYPDCRPTFFHAMNAAICAGTDERCMLVAPFLFRDKQGILERGHSLKVPYELTRTCYKDQPVACGKCGSCQERLEAWSKIGKEDPIEYESRELMSK